MARLIRERPLAALWIAVAVAGLGRLVDLQWHLSHDEFEGAEEQVRAHLVVWIGVLMVLTVSATAVRQGIPGFGYRLALLASIVYVAVALWHFIEHANGADPDVAHVLLGITDVAILGGAIAVTLAARRPSRRGSSGIPG